MASPLLKQTWTMSAVLINMFGQALVLSYPASLLPALSRPDSPFEVDLHTKSWLGSILGVAGLPGFLISSFLMKIYGRKSTHFLMILPGVLGWVLIYFANDISTLMIGRALGGFTSTATVSLGAIVIGEYTAPKHRGVFLYLKNAVVCLGALFSHAMSHLFHWRTIALISEIPLIMSLIIIYTWPESPAWLISKEQYEKSRKSFYWLRGEDEVSQREIEDTIKAQKARMSKPKRSLSFLNKTKIFFKKFTRKDFFKPLLIMLLATTILEVSGRHIFPVYSLIITAEITGESSQSYYYALGIDVIITISALSASILVKTMKRRTLLFSTGFASCGVLVLICAYLFMSAKGIISNDRPVIPLALLGVYFLLANLGCAPIPLALVGEVFPLPHREVGSALSGLWFAFCLMAGLKSTPHLINSVQVHGLFATYGTILAVALLILYFIMPETKDRNLQEIENFFNDGKFNDIDVDEETKIKILKA